MLNEQDKGKIIEFADRHLKPYELQQKPNGDEEIIPEYCPFCGGGGHDRKTFGLSLTYGVFNCLRGSCQKRGYVTELFDQFHEDIQLTSSKDRQQATAEKKYVLPKIDLFPPTEQIYQYFEKRKIPRNIVDDARVKADEKGNIVFTFYENNVLTFIKFRHPYKPSPKQEKEWTMESLRPIFWNLDHCSFSQPLFVCEGMVDAMSLMTAGLTNVVSVPSGVNNLSCVADAFDDLEKFPYIVLFGDNDIPGKQMVASLVKRFGEDRCRVVDEYPVRPGTSIGCKDANEILYYYGRYAVLDVAMSAREIPINGVLDMGKVMPIDPTLIPRIKTGIPLIDKVAGGLVEGGVTVILGRSGAGKSVLAEQFTVSALAQDKKVFVYSGEFSADMLGFYVNLQIAGSDYVSLKYDPVRDEQTPYLPYQTDMRIREWYVGKWFTYDNENPPCDSDMDGIFQVAIPLIRRHDIKLVVIDNLMTAVADQPDEMAAQKSFALKLKRMARKYGVAVLLVCHPRKTRPGESLTQDDISGASTMNNISDLVLAVETGKITILKNRAFGLLKTIPCCWLPDCRRVYQADAGDKLSVNWNREGIPLANPRADSIQQYQLVSPSEPF